MKIKKSLLKILAACKYLLNPSAPHKTKIKISYPPEFKTRYGYGKPKAKYIEAILKEKIKEQLSFNSTIEKYKDFFSKIPVDAPENSEIARWNQPWFPPLDGMSMYAMIAYNQPNKYIEIGSGNSTKFAAQAIKDHRLSTEIISIDPHPRAEIDSICKEIIRTPLEKITKLESIITNLNSNDILFFDGSHHCLQNSDVTSFFIDVLPSIPAGVKIGIHDIFWPNDYPETWIHRYYNEQYILAAYILGQGYNFPLIYSCTFMAEEFKSSVEQCLNTELLNALTNCNKNIKGGTLWFSKPEIPITI